MSCKTSLNFSDIYIEPQYSTIISRSQVKTRTRIFDNLELDVPVLSANMDTITESAMAKAMFDAGGIGVLHRFMSVRENISEFLQCPPQTLVSIGVQGDTKDRAKELYKHGARNFIVDIAHGHSIQMKELLEWLRQEYSDINIMAGNVGTFDGVRDLTNWGAHAVKVGIGPGNACLTKNVTGVTIPQFSAIMECAVTTKALSPMFEVPPYIIADGGIREIGDIAKALGAGAHAVMCGRLFAACEETPGPRINGKKVYRGMASRDAMRRIRNEEDLPTPEGASMIIDDPPTTVPELMKAIKGGLQSSLSYSNSRNLEEFRTKVKFRI